MPVPRGGPLRRRRVQYALPPGTATRTITFGGEARQYLLTTPLPAPAGPVPLVLNLHGYTSNMTQQAGYTRVPEQAAARGWVTVTPQGSGRIPHWTIPPLPGADDVGFLAAVIAATEAELPIDSARVFATGISNGAAMITRLAGTWPGRFAAIAPVAGINAVRADPPTAPPVPLIAFHGTEDKFVPYVGGALFGGLRRGPVRKRLQRGRRYLQLEPVESVVARWAGACGCSGSPHVEALGSDVRHVVYDGDGSVPVELYSVTGGGHTWPGSADVPLLGATTHTIDATALLLDFFARF